MGTLLPTYGRVDERYESWTELGATLQRVPPFVERSTVSDKLCMGGVPHALSHPQGPGAAFDNIVYFSAVCPASTVLSPLLISSYAASI